MEIDLFGAHYDIIDVNIENDFFKVERENWEMVFDKFTQCFYFFIKLEEITYIFRSNFHKIKHEDLPFYAIKNHFNESFDPNSKPELKYISENFNKMIKNSNKFKIKFLLFDNLENDI